MLDTKKVAVSVVQIAVGTVIGSAAYDVVNKVVNGLKKAVESKKES